MAFKMSIKQKWIIQRKYLKKGQIMYSSQVLVIQGSIIFLSKYSQILQTSTFKHATGFRLPNHEVYYNDLDNIWQSWTCSKSKSTVASVVNEYTQIQMWGVVWSNS